MKTKKCKVCGQEFTPASSHQLYCKQTKTATCSICGNLFEYVCQADTNTTTCESCRKRKLYKKTCKFCGKAFITSSPNKSICDGPHYRTCVICGKQFEVPGNRLYDESLNCCSKECSNKKRSESIKKAVSPLPKRWNNSTQVFIRNCKYCGKEFKANQPNRLYCDGPHYNTCVVCGSVFEVSLNQIFNHTSVCSEECRQKLSAQTSILKYGDSMYSKTDEFKFRLQQQQAQTEAKRRETMLQRYGVPSKSSTEDWLRAHMSDPSKYDNLQMFLQNSEEFIRTNFNFAPTVQQLSHIIGINPSSTVNRVHELSCEHLISFKTSSMEAEMIEFLYTLDCVDNIERNSRSIISPLELDIYIRSCNFAIECNPTSTHNSTHNNWDSNISGISPNYHKKKTDAAEAAGIRLLHVFGYEWTHKQEIMKSIIRNALGCCTSKYYARKLNLQKVSYKDAARFLNENHRQGFAASSIQLGLYDNDELISLMTFVRRRHTIGSGKYSWELLRFCSKLNTSVVGGASKLFKYFVTTMLKTGDTIVSFSDRAHTSGKVYEVLGFTLDHISDPGYVWVNVKTDIAYNRVNAQKRNIKKFLHDDNLDMNLSERQLMEDHGFVRVYDSGACVWVYTKR